MLFESLKIRGIALKNRIMVSPMCQYSYEGDFSNCSGWTRTDIGGQEASQSTKKAAETIIWLARQLDNGPTGGFFRNKKRIA